MLSLAIIFIALWLLGLVASYAVGGFIHIFLVVAIFVFLIGLFSRKTRLMPKGDD